MARRDDIRTRLLGNTNQNMCSLILGLPLGTACLLSEFRIDLAFRYRHATFDLTLPNAGDRHFAANVIAKPRKADAIFRQRLLQLSHGHLVILRDA